MGSGLITDNYVAVFELVKNSFDARATEVHISFENMESNMKEPCICIWDNGKGMSYEDLINKWLFVAYSAKSDGSEEVDDDYEKDYRNDSTGFKRRYAGAKGVGRFSCDKLGKKLELITLSKKKNSRIEQLIVNWEDFEKNLKEEFGHVGIQHSTLKNMPYDLPHGTVLKITGVNSDEWGRKEYTHLKRQLAKLIRPDLNQTAVKENFRIFLHVLEEQERDQLEIEKNRHNKIKETELQRRIINGPIVNFVFDSLNIKTTKISASISASGKHIITTLYDRGKLVYKIKEKNNFLLLRNINITLYFLNRSAKLAFKSQVGIETVKYGSIFVYKNGFRIYPYGERGDDSLGIDNRAVQGYNRYIGLRNLIGQIDLQGDIDLYETTSRNGGLIKNKTFLELAEVNNIDEIGSANSFLLSVLRRLEKYVVDVTQWGINREEYDFSKDKNSIDRFIKYITNVLNSNDIDELTYDKNIINFINKVEQNSVQNLIRKFRSLANRTNNIDTKKDVELLEKSIKKLKTAKDSAEKEVDQIRKKAQSIHNELVNTVGQNLFLKSDLSLDKTILISLQHHINHSSNKITSFLKKINDLLVGDIDINKIVKFINFIALENRKIFTMSRCVSKANFDTKTDTLNGDIVQFINEYLINVYSEFEENKINSPNFRVNVKTPSPAFTIKFVPIELIIIIDNILNNAIKAKANYVNVAWRLENENILTLEIQDNGIGINPDYVDKIFDFRFTTTGGSGIGLYHVREILEKMKASIYVDQGVKQGAKFIITFTK